MATAAGKSRLHQPPCPEMTQVSHDNLRLHTEAYASRSPSVATTTPLSPSNTLSPFLHRAAPEPISTPGRAYFSPSRDSFVSKPSVSDASHVHSSPSRSSSASEKRRSGSGPSAARRSQEKRHGAHRQSRHSSGQHSQRASRDVERYGGSRSPPFTPHGRSLVSDVTTVAYDDVAGYDRHEEQKDLEERAVGIMLYLSLPVAIVSFLIAGWTLICLVLFTLAQPLRILKARSSPSSELTYIMSPSLRLQLRLIYSSATSDTYSAGMLITIHLISPFVSIGVAFASWVATCFWFFSAILGDPAGQDGHNDGKASIVAVRTWWEGWLCRGLR